MKKFALIALTTVFVATLCVNVDAADKKKKEKKPMDRAAIFAKLDKNSDSKLSKEEFSVRAKTDEQKEKIAKAFGRIDKNKDGSISKEEFTSVQPPKKKKPE
ncbi:EF-hand domain-containing protein [Planctomycetaceae bacterium]|jgi:Ca2+-binding EF-hand superfamily protein|nr:EF-hand domain-containing protein [Planctomycetaceae bacterium]MDG2389270.1 EF-hand domain-containing protein [Planctomycetaceae bacterium]